MKDKPAKFKIDSSRFKRLDEAATAAGLKLEICRGVARSNPKYGTFRILDANTNVVVCSGSKRPDAYGLGLDEVERFLAHYLTTPPWPKEAGVMESKSTKGSADSNRRAKPKGNETLSQDAPSTKPHPTNAPTDSGTPTLTDRNVALLEEVARNLEQAIEQYTTQLRTCRDMIRRAKNEP